MSPSKMHRFRLNQTARNSGPFLLNLPVLGAGFDHSMLERRSMRVVDGSHSNMR